MSTFRLPNHNLRRQYLISILGTLAISFACFLISDLLGYRVVALILLVTVSICAIFLELLPVLTAAILSALIWNFFFIPPRFTLHIKQAEDILMFLMYFLIALVNAVFTNRIRKAEKEANKKRERENTITLYNTLLNSLSHELRTPISVIIGATDNLQSIPGRLSEFQKQELVEEISKSAFLLNRQVENLLNMSRLESGHLSPKNDWVDVKELIYDVINHVTDDERTRQITVSSPENLPLFKLDNGLLFQVLHNLLHNALIYVPNTAKIQVHVRCHYEGLLIYVDDTGPGFPKDEIDLVFDKFYRLKHSRTGGTGLGLSIVKGFVEAMNGSIELENLSEGGARFRIIIPCELSHINSEKL